MTPERAKKLLPVFTAFSEGKSIQYREIGLDQQKGSSWMDVSNPNFAAGQYRIKPEPKEVWVNEYSCGSMCIYSTKERACGQTNSNQNIARWAVKYREVIENETK